MRRTVEVGLKGDTSFIELPELGERHYLEAAGIGQNRPWPAHEFMQATEASDPLGPGPQHQMIHVAQNDFGPGRAHLLGQHRLDRRRRADGHESRRAYDATGRGNAASARVAITIVEFKREPPDHSPLSLQPRRATFTTSYSPASVSFQETWKRAPTPTRRPRRLVRHRCGALTPKSIFPLRLKMKG